MESDRGMEQMGWKGVGTDRYEQIDDEHEYVCTCNKSYQVCKLPP